MQFCTVDGRDGTFQIIRRGRINTRVRPLDERESTLVPTTSVHEVESEDPDVAGQPEPPDDSSFRCWMKKLFDSWGPNPEWPSFLFWLLESEYLRQRAANRPRRGDVFRDRDEEALGRAEECDVDSFERWGEERLTQALYDRCHLGSTQCPGSSGLFQIGDEAYWLLGYEFPTCGGPADLVGLTQEGSLVVFECKGALNNYTPFGAILEGLDYLSALTQEGNFANLQRGFGEWRNKLEQEGRVPPGFESAEPVPDAKHSVIVLAPKEYYDLYIRSNRGLKDYPLGWDVLSQRGRDSCESLSIGLAVCDFYRTTEGTWLEDAPAVE